MLSSGVESLLDSSGSAGIEEAYPGLLTSISTELMAVSEPKVGLSAKPGVSVPVLAHSSGLSVEHRATPAVENFGQDLDDVLQVISHGPAQSLDEELVKSGDLEQDEKGKKKNFRRLDFSSERYQRGGEEAQDAEEYPAECWTPAPGRSLAKQEDLHLNQHEFKPLGTCCTEVVGSLKNTEENQAHVQMTAETLPKLTEEVQGPKKREPGACEEEEVSSLTANPSEYSASLCGTCPLLSNRNVQAEKTLHPMENQCLACQSEFDGPIPGSKQHLESLNKPPNTGLQTMASSVEETKISIGSSQSEEIMLKTGDDLPPVTHKYAREDSFQGTLKESVMDLDSLNGERNERHSGDMGFVSDLTEEKTIEQKEHKNRCEREDNGSLEQSFPDSKSHCSQHACFIKCAKEKAEPVLAGNKMQQSLPKVKSSVEDQENPVSAQFLPFSSIPGSLSYKPESMNVLSETENKSLRIKSILSNSCPQLTFQPCKETDTQKGIAASHFRKFDTQESYETEVDSETPSALNVGISLPKKEKLCLLSGNTQMDNCDSSAAEAFSKDSSVTKPLSVTMSDKRKANNTEVPLSDNEAATSFLNGAKCSRVCAYNKESLRGEGHSMLSVKDMDVIQPKSTHCREKFKNTCIEEKMGREVAPKKNLPTDSFLDGEDCPWAFSEDSKKPASKIVPLSTENYGKVLEEIPRSNLNNLSKERKNDTKLTNLAGTSVLSETVCDCQAEAASDAETSPELQCNPTPPFYPPMINLSNSCKELPPDSVVCNEVCVPYKLNAQSKDNVNLLIEGQDATPTHSVCKENEVSGSERLDQIEKCQVPKQKKKCKKMEEHLSDNAQQEQKSEYQEKAKITLRPLSLIHI